jgi:hypothetical protein
VAGAVIISFGSGTGPGHGRTLPSHFGPPAALAGAKEVDQTPIAWSPELSGAARLPDGTLALVDDEIRDALFLWDQQHPPSRLPLGLRLDDLEGAAGDSSGTLYLMTSHSLTRRGRLRSDRQRLARLQRPWGTADIEVVDDLRPLLLTLLGAESGQLNLEGLAWYPRDRRLLLGARAPLSGGLAQVVSLGPVEELFEEPREPGDLQGLDPRLHTLDLGGRGIRSLDYDPWRRAVLVLAGPGTAGPRFALFLWNPEEGRIEPLEAPELARLKQPEGVVAAGPPDPSGEGPLLLIGEGAPPLRLLAREPLENQ